MTELELIYAEFSKDTLIYFFVPIFLLALVFEFWFNNKNKLNLFEKKDTRASLWMMVYTIFVDIVPKFAAFAAFYYLHKVSPLADLVLRQWWAWLILFFLDDFTYYWMHRMNHQVRFLWAGHVPHHSAIKMNFATALRQGVGERVHKYLFWLPLPLLGFDPLMVFTMMSVSLFYQYWLHTELIGKLPAWVEFIFNTPSHHRVHHASNIRYLDCNHAGIFIVWDRLFGSFSPEVSSEKPIYGLTENIKSYRPWDVATHEYAAILGDVRKKISWRDKLKYIFWSPGWSHDGPDKRAKTLRAKLR